MINASTTTCPVDLPEPSNGRVVDAPSQTERGSLQSRMDEEMQRYNLWSAQGISVAEEYGRH